jgi:hypothetical protein
MQQVEKVQINNSMVAAGIQKANATILLSSIKLIA